MSVNLIPEADLRQALRPYHCDPAAFEAEVRRRLAAAETRLAPVERAPDPFVGVSPWLRSVATFLPLGMLLGCRTAPPSATREATARWGPGLLGYLTFPAVSLFFLMGAAVFGVLGLRRVKDENHGTLDDQEARTEAIRQWWSDNRRGAQGVFAVSLILALIGKAWLLFLFYVVSFGILLYCVAAFARRGVGDRQFVAATCASGLMFLGQLAAFSGIGVQDIHFLDQRLVAAVFFAGALVLLPFGPVAGPSTVVPLVRLPIRSWIMMAITTGLLLTTWLISPSKNALLLGLLLIVPALFLVRVAATGRQIRAGGGGHGRLAFVALLLVPLIGWLASSILLPATPTRIRNYVESFDHAEYSTVSWRRWEIVADWARRTTPDLDLAKPRQLLAREIAGDQNPFILGNATRAGLLQRDQVGQLRNYSDLLQSLVEEAPQGLTPRSITSLQQRDWVIRAAVLHGDLSPAERDRLAARLQVTLEELGDAPYVGVEAVLRATQLLAVLGRPVDIDRERARVHDLLRKFHTTSGGGFELAGGFRTYLPSTTKSWISMPGDLEPTAYAVELMEIYGIPDGIDLNWVRSYLRPTFSRRSDDQWAAAATLDRLNHLPGAPSPTWTDRLHHERPLLAALVLVGLCLYATLCSPLPSVDRPIVQG